MVTIDAMGCQTEILEKIVEKKADACIAVKQNQPKLYEAIEQHIDELTENDELNAQSPWANH
jgi:predicted transposase YbfD/YdcC